jgi:hypothetical protein
MSRYKELLINNAKNALGRKTRRKIVVFSVDDYGNVRLDSAGARKRLDEAGLKVLSRFDAYDTLETAEDLEALYETLRSVKDKNGRSAVFTPFALPCNIDFEKIIENDFSSYYYEMLPATFEKLGAPYQKCMQLWKEGISEGIMVPQFHGREHLNLKVFEEKLSIRDNELLIALKNRSYTSISSSGYSTISVTAAFEFWKMEENAKFLPIIKDGLECFEKVFGQRAVQFNSPGGREHPQIHAALREGGVKYIDTPWIKNEHQGEGKYKRILNFTGKKNRESQFYCVRNCLFEPSVKKSFDWVGYTLRQIETAFNWSKPALISSHRVNFCGHIDEKFRKQGLVELKSLLRKITSKWPDVEFMAAHELSELLFNA